MLNDLMFSVNAVVPIFLVMLLGIVIRKIGLIDAHTTSQINAMVFKVAFPVNIFANVSGADFSQILDVRFMLFTIISLIIFFLICCGVAAILVPDKKMKGAFIQGSFRGNYVIIGISLVPGILGFDSVLSVATIILVIPLFNILSVIILTIHSGQKLASKGMLLSIVLGIVKNPLIIGIFAGICFSLLPVNMPFILDTSINFVSDLTAPLALLIIGASMDFSKVKARLSPTVIACALKLVIMPLIFIPIAMHMGINTEGIVILFVLYSAPTAVASYVMASNMGSDGQLASNIILLSSLFSIFTCTAGVYILRVIGVV